MRFSQTFLTSRAEKPWSRKKYVMLPRYTYMKVTTAALLEEKADWEDAGWGMRGVDYITWMCCWGLPASSQLVPSEGPSLNFLSFTVNPPLERHTINAQQLAINSVLTKICYLALALAFRSQIIECQSLCHFWQPCHWAWSIAMWVSRLLHVISITTKVKMD